MNRFVTSGAILALCGLLMCTSAGAEDGNQNKDDGELQKLLDRRAEVELSLIRKRAEIIRENPEAQRIQEKIVELYAELHKELGKNEKISKLRNRLSELEKQIEEKRLGENPNEKEKEEEQENN